jgi:RNA recognition motif-containing protein
VDSERNAELLKEIAKRKVFISNIKEDIHEDDIEQYFESFGAIEEVLISRDPATQQSKGFGFVVFLEPESLHRVLTNGRSKRIIKIKNQDIIVRAAIPKKDIENQKGDHQEIPPIPSAGLKRKISKITKSTNSGGDKREITHSNYNSIESSGGHNKSHQDLAFQSLDTLPHVDRRVSERDLGHLPSAGDLNPYRGHSANSNQNLATEFNQETRVDQPTQVCKTYQELPQHNDRGRLEASRREHRANLLPQYQTSKTLNKETGKQYYSKMPNFLEPNSIESSVDSMKESQHNGKDNKLLPSIQGFYVNRLVRRESETYSSKPTPNILVHKIPRDNLRQLESSSELKALPKPICLCTIENLVNDDDSNIVHFLNAKRCCCPPTPKLAHDEQGHLTTAGLRSSEISTAAWTLATATKRGEAARRTAGSCSRQYRPLHGFSVSSSKYKLLARLARSRPRSGFEMDFPSLTVLETPLLSPLQQSAHAYY